MWAVVPSQSQKCRLLGAALTMDNFLVPLSHQPRSPRSKLEFLQLAPFEGLELQSATRENARNLLNLSPCINPISEGLRDSAQGKKKKSVVCFAYIVLNFASLTGSFNRNRRKQKDLVPTRTTFTISAAEILAWFRIWLAMLKTAKAKKGNFQMLAVFKGDASHTWVD